MSQRPARCSDREFERRHEAVRKALLETDLDAILVYGNFHGWQNVFYLSNHWDLVSCFLLFPARGEPVLITGVYPHLAAVRNVSMIPDVRFGGARSIETIGELLRDRGIEAGRIGIVEPDSFRLPGIPYREMTRLQEMLAGAELINVTPLLEAIRRSKSPEEIALLRDAARLTDQCYRAVIDAVRPGITELELAHVIAATEGDTVAVLVGSTAMSEPRLPNPSIRPTDRELRHGDVVMVELSKGLAGLAGQVHGTITLGEPTDRIRELHDIAENAHRSIASRLRAGCRPEDVVEAASIITESGYVIANPLVHGFGMGLEAGLHVGMPGSPAYWPNGDFSFPAGASVTIEPNPCTRDMLVGGTAGGLVIVTDDGCEEVQETSHDGLIVK